MKNSVFSARLYKEGLRRSKVVFFIFLAVIVLNQLVYPLVGGLLELMTRIDLRGIDTVGPSEILSGMLPIPYVMAPVLTLVLFFCFDRRSSSDFYQALPYTRVSIFSSWTLVSLTLTVGLTLFGTILGYVSRLALRKIYIVSTLGLWNVLLSYLAAILFSTACMLIAISLTGTFFSNVCLAVVIMFLPRFVLGIVRTIILQTVNVLNPDHFLNFLSPHYNVFLDGPYSLFRSLFEGGELLFWQGNTGPVIYTILLSLGYYVLGAFLFRMRRSETAGTSALNRPVQAAIRIAITFTVSAFGTWLLMGTRMAQDSIIFAVIIYCIALIVFFAYEIITTHKWKNLLLAMPGLLIVAVLNLALWGFVTIGANHILNQVPQPSEIRSVEVLTSITPYSTINYRSSQNDAGNNYTELDDPQFKEIVSKALAADCAAVKNDTYYETDLQDSVRLSVAIHAGGRPLYRNIRITRDQFVSFVRTAAGSEAFRTAFMDMPDPVFPTLTYGIQGSYFGGLSDQATEGEARTIFRCMQEEVNSLGFEKWFEISSDSDYRPLTLQIEYTEDTSLLRHIYFNVSAEALPKTFELVLKTYYDKQDMDLLPKLLEHRDLFYDLLKTGPEDTDVSDSKAIVSGFTIGMTILAPYKDGTLEQFYTEADGYRDDTADPYSAAEQAANRANLDRIYAVLEGCSKTTSVPSSDGFILLNYHFFQEIFPEDDYPDDLPASGMLMLPLPDGFDPEEYQDILMIW